MIILPEDIKNNVEIKNLNNTNDFSNTDENIHNNEDNIEKNIINGNILEKNIVNENVIEENIVAQNIIEENEDFSSNNQDIVNCLALTVQKDYSLTIAKNVVIKTLKTTWRVTISLFALNLLKFFF